MEQMQIAKTIIEQMGGFGRLGAMVNGRDYMARDAGVQFSFSGKRGMNKCVVDLDFATDTYSMEFWFFNKRTGECGRVGDRAEGLYCDMLKPYFEQRTGLYLSL